MTLLWSSGSKKEKKERGRFNLLLCRGHFVVPREVGQAFIPTSPEDEKSKRGGADTLIFRAIRYGSVFLLA